MKVDSGYRVITREELTDGVITLRAIEQKDIESIRLWRNAQMDVLRQVKPISAVEQQRYFELNVWPEKESNEPKQILLAIIHKGKLIGYGGLVNLHWIDRRAELSFLLADEIEAQPTFRAEIFMRFLLLIKEITFKNLNLQRIWTETYANREAHIKTLEASGFILEGCMRKHVVSIGERVDSLIHGVLHDDYYGEGSET